jgi:hypothetical protein
MANRGRPKKDGVKPGWTLFRTFLVLHAYNEARAKGNKHYAAIDGAVSAVRSQAPEMPISATEVKRVLARFQSKDSKLSWITTDGIAQGPELDILFDNHKWLAEIAEKFPGILNESSLPGDEFKPRRLRILTIQIGPRPRYPRNNART